MEKYAHTTRARETKPKLAAIVKGSLTCHACWRLKTRQLRFENTHQRSALKSGSASPNSVETSLAIRLSPEATGANANPTTRHENPTQTISLGSESSTITVSPRLRSTIDRKPASATIEPANAIANRLRQRDCDKRPWGHKLRPYLPGKFRQRNNGPADSRGGPRLDVYGMDGRLFRHRGLPS
jgi:hypothetical protein